jgi:hypothetical protein
VNHPSSEYASGALILGPRPVRGADGVPVRARAAGEGGGGVRVRLPRGRDHHRRRRRGAPATSRDALTTLRAILLS